MAAALGLRDRDGREVHQHLKAWARPALARALGPAGHSPQTVPWGPPAHPVRAEWPRAGWARGSWGGGWDLPLTSLSVWQPPLHHLLDESPTNGRSLAVSHSLIVGRSVTVGRLGAGPTAAPTSGWAGLRGNHSLPGNRVGVLMAHSNWGLLRAVLSGTLLQLDKGIPFKSHNPQSMIKAQQPGFSPQGEY